MGRRREKAGGRGRRPAREGPAGVAGDWSCRFEPDQGFTAGHNSMCGDCVEGLASTAAAGPSAGVCVCVCGFRFFGGGFFPTFFSFSRPSLLPAVC